MGGLGERIFTNCRGGTACRIWTTEAPLKPEKLKLRERKGLCKLAPLTRSKGKMEAWLLAL